MNTLEERDSNLGGVEYDSLLAFILDHLKKTPDVFQRTFRSLTIDVEKVAIAVAHDMKTSKPVFQNTFGTRIASVNFEDVDARLRFRKQIEQIYEELQTQLGVVLDKARAGLTATQYIPFLLTSIGQLKDQGGSPQQPAGLQYSFGTSNLEEERLRLRAKGIGEIPWLKGHKLTISIGHLDIKGFNADLVNGIYRHFEETYEAQNANPNKEEDLERTRAVLEQLMQDKDSDLNKVKRLVGQESLGRLQREAKLCYLEFLRDGIKEWKAKRERGLALLESFIQRLRKLDTYINDPNRAYRDYQASYNGIAANYRDLFVRADAFDMVPVISEIEGSLGETYDPDKGEQAFTSGIMSSTRKTEH